MIFLLDYDRSKGHLVSMQTFVDLDRHQAEDARLSLELQHLRAGIEREVMLLEAVNEAHLHQTHQRYFQSLAEIGASVVERSLAA